MAIINHAKREINAKIVYYGPEGAGKGTSLRYAYNRIKPSLRGELKTLPVSGSSLLFFDFSPFEQPVFDGYRICLHIYTLQGQVANPAAWKMTLKGADGLVIVADASSALLTETGQSLTQVREFLNSYGMGLEDIPVVLQLNKADLCSGVSAAATASALGLDEGSVCLTTAASGDGVLEVLTSLSRQIMERIRGRRDVQQENPQDASTDTEFENNPANSQFAPEIAEESEAIETKISSPDEVPLASALPSGTDLQAIVTEGRISVEGGNVRIPLEIVSAAGVQQRLVITVSILPG